MSEHERIRELLPLAASGDISPEEIRLVREHLTRCDTCARVSEDFVALGSALRGLPTPLPRAELVIRVRELADLRLGRKRAWSGDAVVLAPLVAAGWIMALVPYFVGVILYFILRDPLPTPCHRCGMEVPQAFAFCPGCGASIHPICSQCGKSLQPEWSNCPHCGTRLVSAGAVSSS